MMIAKHGAEESQNFPIAVLGAGSWGTALALLLADNGQLVHLWGHNPQHIAQMQQDRCNNRHLPGIIFPDNILLFDQLSVAIKGVQDIIIVTPSHVFGHLLQQLKPNLTDQMRVAWGTKGLEPKTGKLLHVVASEILGEQVPTAVLSGPSFAGEVALKRPTAITIAATNADFAHSLSHSCNNAYFRAYTTDDIIGVEVCGAVKNILAIASGVVNGLQLGINAISALITRGLAEMQRLGVALGGKPNTFTGLAGLGDLVLTCFGQQSRNRRFGEALAAGKNTNQAISEIGQVVEGLHNLKAVYHLAQELNVEMPILEQIYQVIYHHLPTQTAIENLFAREPRGE